MGAATSCNTQRLSRRDRDYFTFTYIDYQNTRWHIFYYRDIERKYVEKIPFSRFSRSVNDGSRELLRDYATQIGGMSQKFRDEISAPTFGPTSNRQVLIDGPIKL